MIFRNGTRIVLSDDALGVGQFESAGLNRQFPSCRSLARKLRFGWFPIKHNPSAPNKTFKEHHTGELCGTDYDTHQKGYERLSQLTSDIREAWCFLRKDTRQYISRVPGQNERGEKKC
jgi:hypothetical protein